MFTNVGSEKVCSNVYLLLRNGNNILFVDVTGVLPAVTILFVDVTRVLPAR